MELDAQIRNEVAARTPVDEREERSIAEFLTAFDRLSSPFDERADPVHVTGSAIVLGPRGVLLLRHKRLGIWLQPGGHIDPGETPWAAALREAHEETGLGVRFLDDPPTLVHVDVHAGTSSTVGRPTPRHLPARARRSDGSAGTRPSHVPTTGSAAR
jgi:hypothetical protein